MNEDGYEDVEPDIEMNIEEQIGEDLGNDLMNNDVELFNTEKIILEINLELEALCTPVLVDFEVRRIWQVETNKKK